MQPTNKLRLENISEARPGAYDQISPTTSRLRSKYQIKLSN